MLSLEIRTDVVEDTPYDWLKGRFIITSDSSYNYIRVIIYSQDTDLEELHPVALDGYTDFIKPASGTLEESFELEVGVYRQKNYNKKYVMAVEVSDTMDFSEVKAGNFLTSENSYFITSNGAKFKLADNDDYVSIFTGEEIEELISSVLGV